MCRLRRVIDAGESAATPFYVIAQALAIVVPVFLLVLGATELAYHLG
jgi:hypothetical protein